MSSLKGLEALSRGYLGQEWNLFGTTPDEVVIAFAREEPADVPGAVASLKCLLASMMTEDELAQHWVLELRSGYDPRDDGYTFREWFTHALELLRSEAAARPADS